MRKKPTFPIFLSIIVLGLLGANITIGEEKKPQELSPMQNSYQKSPPGQQALIPTVNKKGFSFSKINKLAQDFIKFASTIKIRCFLRCGGGYRVCGY